MTLESLLEEARQRLQRRFDPSVQSLTAIYDDDLWKILDQLGLLASLDEGKLRCHLTGVTLNRENVGGLVGTPNGPRIIADIYSLSED